MPGLAYTYVLAVPGPLAVRVTVTRRDPTSGLFVMEHGDAAAREAAEVAVLSVLGSYDKLLNDFVAFPRYPRDACLDVWAVASDLCFKVSFIGGEPTGASLGAAVAACCMSALFRSLLEPGLGLTGQVSIRTRPISHTALVPDSGPLLGAVAGDAVGRAGAGEAGGREVGCRSCPGAVDVRAAGGASGVWPRHLRREGPVLAGSARHPEARAV